MIDAPDRGLVTQLIKEAVGAGARLAPACELLGLSVRTLQRWIHRPVDGRPIAVRASPAHKLSQAERQAVLHAVNQPGYASLTPHQIVPKLADQGIYLASESTFYRVMKEAGDVYEHETSELAARLLTKGCLREKTAGKPLVLHSDNGAAMKGFTMLAAMQDLGVASSFSRLRVSNDNAFAEALFRTAKYCPLWPERPFETLEAARQWVHQFTGWYNEEHRHSALKYVTPAQRHDGHAQALLTQRKALYEEARARHPNRWTVDIRNWKIEDAVYLNPERDQASLEKQAT
jgi:transposase InsO family protein